MALVHNIIIFVFIILRMNFGLGQGNFSLQSSSSIQVAETPVELCIHAGSVQCPVEEFVTNFGTFNFPAIDATLKGTPVILPCPFGVKNTGAELIFPAADGTTSATTEGFHIVCLLSCDPQKGHVGKWKVLDDGSGCRKRGVNIEIVKVRTTFLENTLTANNIRQADVLLLTLLEQSVEDYESAITLIESITRVLEMSDIFPTDPTEDPYMTRIKNNLLAMIETYTLYVKLRPGERVTVETAGNGMKVETLLFPDSSVPVQSYDFESLQLSTESIQMARAGSESGKARLQMTSYSNDLFFHWGTERDWADNSTDQCLIENDTSLDDGFRGQWRIISLSFDGVEIQNLTQPIVYVLPVTPPKDGDKQWVCAFWEPIEKKWSLEGMKTLTFSDSVQCESSHLTAFSALLDPIPRNRHDEDPNDESSSSSIPSIHLHILSVLSSVGSALSITGLAVTTLTYGLFRCMRKERSNKILLHLSISLLLLHLMSLSGDRSMWRSYCVVPALLLHYFLLSSLAWMLVEGVHMYQMLISVFVKPEARFLLKRLICAYGIPLVIVIISAGIDMDAYSEGREDACVMAGHMPLYLITYLSPVGIILAINAFIFARIIQVLCKQNSRTQQQQFGTVGGEKKGDKKLNHPFKDFKFAKGGGGSSTHHLSPVQIKGAITVMLLLGVGWILGLLAIGPFQLVFRYLFTICNAGQGVFIFLFRVILHPQACRTWRKAVIGSSSMDSEAMTSSSGARRGQSRPSFSVSPTFVSNANSVENTLTRSDPMSVKLATALASLLNQNSGGQTKGLTTLDEKPVKF